MIQYAVQISGVIDAPTKADAELLISSALETLTWHGGQVNAHPPIAVLRVIDGDKNGDDNVDQS